MDTITRRLHEQSLQLGHSTILSSNYSSRFAMSQTISRTAVRGRCHSQEVRHHPQQHQQSALQTRLVDTSMGSRGILFVLALLGSETAAVVYQGPPPSYKHTAFRLIVPQHAIEQGSLHWHDALRHAAFLSLRRGIGSYDDSSEATLWRRVSTAQVSSMELAKPVDEDADITTLASGVLISEAGHFAFVPEAAVLESGSFKVSALWTILRVRHSGPGLRDPRIEYYFTVQPASHLTLLDYIERQRNKVVFKKPFPKPKPTYVYKEVPVPIYSTVPGQYYTPQFVSRYRTAIQKYVLKSETESDEESFYTIPTLSRYMPTPSFPRVSHHTEVPRIVNIVIPRHPLLDHAAQETIQSDVESKVFKSAEESIEDAKEKDMVQVITHSRSNFTTNSTTAPTLQETTTAPTLGETTTVSTLEETTTVEPEESTTPSS